MNTDKNEIFLSQDAVINALDMKSSSLEWKDQSLRLYIEGKGCDGFYYGVCFDKEQDGDVKFKQSVDQGSIDLLVDLETLKYTSGSQIIWVDDERGKGFLVENPNHRRFRGKFFKRNNWEQRLLEKK